MSANYNQSQEDLLYFQSLSDSEKSIFICFGTLKPALAAYPNCIFRRSRRTLETILGIVLQKPGWYGGDPVSYIHLLPDAELWLIEHYPDQEQLADFIDSLAGWRWFWNWPGGEEIILNFASRCLDDNFNFVLNVDVPDDVLSLIEPQKVSLDGLQGDFYLEKVLPNLIDKLGWAYIPLDSELGYIMFVTDTSHKPWVDLLIQKLRIEDNDLAVLRAEANKVIWEQVSANS